MKKVKMLCFDMDGTIADLYHVPDWLNKLDACDPSPYTDARPLWDMTKLVEALTALNIEVRIISWLSKSSKSKAYDDEVRKAKIDWLRKYNFPFTKCHIVRYGATKADSVRKVLDEDEMAILFDDNRKVRNGWTLGATVDPTQVDIIEYIKGLAD